jgi:hypothetical protein
MSRATTTNYVSTRSHYINHDLDGDEKVFQQAASRRAARRAFMPNQISGRLPVFDPLINIFNLRFLPKQINLMLYGDFFSGEESPVTRHQMQTRLEETFFSVFSLFPFFV